VCLDFRMSAQQFNASIIWPTCPCRRLTVQLSPRCLNAMSNDQNLWMVLGEAGVKGRTFPRKI